MPQPANISPEDFFTLPYGLYMFNCENTVESNGDETLFVYFLSYIMYTTYSTQYGVAHHLYVADTLTG